MKIINSQDFLMIRSESLISQLDLEFLSEAYAPIIGLEAIGLYLFLKQQDQLQEGQTFLLPQWLTLMQTTLQTFHQARIHLEAIGLLKTFNQTYEKTQLFTLTLFAPKSPFQFFEDPILRGLLSQRVSLTYFKKIEQKYAKTALDTLGQEVSVSFGEVFHPDLNHPAFLIQPSTQVKGKTFSEIKQKFDLLQFGEQLKTQFSIDVNKLNADDIKQMISIATLTGLDELATAEIVGTHLDMNHRLQMDKIIQAARQEKRLPFIRQRQQQKIQIQETSTQAVLINQMEMLTPLAFLSMKQQGTDVSPSDFSLLLRLQSQYDLPNPVINALIHHVLITQNNILSSRYVEKLAGSLKRENLQHALDTMDYFFQISQPRPSKYPVKPPTVLSTPPSDVAEEKNETKIVDEEELAQLETKMKGLK